MIFSYIKQKALKMKVGESKISLKKISDEQILSLINNQETLDKGFNILVRKFKEKIYWHIAKMVTSHSDADDIMQNTFIRAWKNIKSFRGDSQLYTWLYRIAINETMSFIKYNSKNKVFNSDIFLCDRDTGQNMDINPKAIESLLQRAVNSLPDKQKKVFLLRYYNNTHYDKMGEILNTNTNTLKATYHIAQKKVETFLKNNV